MNPSCAAPCTSHALKVAAGVKHFTVYDGPEEGRFSLDAAPPPQDLEATWLAPWRRLLQHTGPHPLSGVMASYSAVEGVPLCANRRRDPPYLSVYLPVYLSTCLPAHHLPNPSHLSRRSHRPQVAHRRPPHRHGLLGLGGLRLRRSDQHRHEAPLPAQRHLRRRRRHRGGRRHLL